MSNASERNADRPTADLHEGDCLEVLAALDAPPFDLVYLDPPFGTGTRRRAAGGHYEDRLDRPEAWVAWLRPRLAAAIERLVPDGAVLLHVDWRTSHHARLLLDELLGPERFVNHLVWSYGLGGSSPRRFARKHDDILYYARSDRYHFEPPRVPATSRRMAGMTKKMTDVLEVPSINNNARERTGWPDQKPLALLELLVGATCPPGGRVLDPACGSGTTLVAAVRTGRSAVGIDLAPRALAIVRARLAAVRDRTDAHAPAPGPADG